MHIHKHLIRETDCNANYELRMAPLFSIMQESVEDDKAVAQFDHQAMQASGNFFVLVQMIVDMKRMPKVKETITIKTWPAGIDRLFPLRKYEIYDEEENLIGEVESVWAIIDIVKRRALRPQKAYPETDWGKPEFLTSPRIKPAENLVRYDEFITKYSDIDANHHVNNARYIAWVEDAVGHTPLNMATNYIAETKFNDKITAFKNDKQVAFYSDQKLVFIAEIDN